MSQLGKSNAWFMAGMLLLVGLLAACSGEDATATSAPVGQPGPTDTVKPEVPTPTAPEPPAAEEKTVYVGPFLVDCVGVGPQKCMLIKENLEDDYTFFYDQIEGFNYEEGYEYELLVKTEPVENPPADASSIKWTLIEEVSKTVSLEGRPWTLESFVTQEGFASVLAGTDITAVFSDDGNLAGSAGCNNYSTSYEVDGNTISIGLVASTMMMCAEPEGIMEQESAYLAALESAATFEISGDQLEMRDAEGTRVASYVASPPVSLEGTSWDVIAYNNGKEAVVSVIIDTEITVSFGEDGTLTGSAGCNNYTASYEADGENISVGPAATTRKMCGEPEGIMEQEAQYLAALESVTTYQIQGDRLEMRTTEGALAVSLQPADTAALPPELMTALKNMTYKIDTTQSGEAPLTDGEYREQAAPGSATETVVQITEHVASGTMSDGQPAAAVILVSDPGGSGTFYYLSLVTLQDGQPLNVATTLLGDRVQINSLSIDGGQIIVDMVTQGPNDPFCCPTQRVVQTYELQGGELVQTSSEVVDSPDSSAPDITGKVWKWEQLTTPVDSTTVDVPDNYTVEFMPDGQVAVKADCNNGAGTYTIDGSTISIEIKALTMAMCPPGSLSDEFVKNLNAAAIYFMEGDNLFIDLIYDSGTMKFVP